MIQKFEEFVSINESKRIDSKSLDLLKSFVGNSKLKMAFGTDPGFIAFIDSGSGKVDMVGVSMNPTKTNWPISDIVSDKVDINILRKIDTKEGALKYYKLYVGEDYEAEDDEYDIYEFSKDSQKSLNEFFKRHENEFK